MKVLFWNINNFSDARMNDPAAVPIIAAVANTTTPDIIVIVEVTAVTAAEVPIDGSLPDWGGQNWPSGVNGLRMLVDELNHNLQPPQWRLVPPLYVAGGDPAPGRRELVGVIFHEHQDGNHQPQLIFTGPWKLCDETVGFDFTYGNGSQFVRPPGRRIRSYIPDPGAPYLAQYNVIVRNLAFNYNFRNQARTQYAIFQRTPLAQTAQQNYPNGFNSLRPYFQNSTVPPGSAYNPNEQTLFLGGQWLYSYLQNQTQYLIGFPDERRFVNEANLGTVIPFNDPQNDITFFDVSMLSLSAASRAPYLVTFWDAIAGRNIKLLAVHTSPVSAAAAMQHFAYVQEVAALQQNELCIVAGDFNVDTFQNLAAYNSLLQQGYELGLDPRGANGLAFPRRPNCMTHLLTVINSLPFDTPGNVGRGTTDPNVFLLDQPGDSPGGPLPAMGCMGAMGGMNFQTPGYGGSIDNFLVAHNNAAQNAAAYVVNPVTGSVYNPVQVSPINLPTQLNNPAYAAGVARTQNAALDALQFQATGNLGKIRNTSDHLPILLEFN